LKGKTLDKGVMDTLVAQMDSFFASKIDCSATPESPIGFELHSVSFAECGDGFVKVGGGSKTLDWSTEFAVVEGSGGKAVLVWQPAEQELLSGSRLSQDIAYRFEFDDEGKISKFAQESDTTAFIADVGTKNVATVLSVFDKAKLLLKGNTLSPALMATLAGELASSYAPAVDCSMSPASSSGYDLRGVPFHFCLAKAQEFLGDAKQVDWAIDAVAPVPASGGTSILLWQKNAMEVAGLPLTMNSAFKVDFNVAGLITSFAQELDTSAVFETRARAASLASEASLAAQLSDLVLPGFLLGCFVGSIPLAVLLAHCHRLGSREGYSMLAV